MKSDSQTQAEKDLKELQQKNQKLETDNEKMKLELKYQEQYMAHEQKRFTKKLTEHAGKSDVQQEKILQKLTVKEMEYEDLRSFCEGRHRYVLQLLQQIKSLRQQLKEKEERNEYLS